MQSLQCLSCKEGNAARYYALELVKDYTPPEGLDKRQRLFKCPLCGKELYILLTMRQFDKLFPSDANLAALEF